MNIHSNLLTGILAGGVSLILTWLLPFCFYHLWNYLCVKPQKARDLSTLVLVPFLSPAVFFIMWWNIPDKGSGWNVWVIVNI
jgi:hypothetical protein